MTSAAATPARSPPAPRYRVPTPPKKPTTSPSWSATTDVDGCGFRSYFHAHVSGSAGEPKAASKSRRSAGRSAGEATRKANGTLRWSLATAREASRDDLRRRRQLPVGRPRAAGDRGAARGRGAAGLPLEAVAVVNSGDPEEVRAVSDAADVTIDSGENLGYAAGLNRGVAAARGDVLFLMNPDVTLRPGATGALFAALRSAPLTMAGPAMFLDEEESLLIPLYDEPSPLDLARRRILLDPRGAARVFARRLPRVLRASEAVARRETFTVTSLSGAMMAVTRESLEAVGPFDARYRLYFEENDWQRRLRRRGGRLLAVGGARAVHPYGRTTQGEPRAASWFAESERRYFSEHFGARGTAALDALAGSASNLAPWPKLPVEGALSWEGEALGVAVSPLRSFDVFGFGLLPGSARSWRPPAGFREMLAGSTWHARAVADRSGTARAEVTLRA